MEGEAEDLGGEAGEEVDLPPPLFPEENLSVSDV